MWLSSTSHSRRIVLPSRVVMSSSRLSRMLRKCDGSTKRHESCPTASCSTRRLMWGVIRR